MSFYMSFKRLVRKFGIDIKVYPYQDPSKTKHYHYVAGDLVQDEEQEEAQPIQLHEPVVPFSSHDSFMLTFMNGGTSDRADLLWISNHLYPDNTIVEVPSQPGQKYRVVNHSSYLGYSDVVIYELKGDDHHPDGK